MSATPIAPSGQHGDAERVLQPRGRGRAVGVAEVEQPLADGGVQRAVGGEPPQRRGLGVDEPQPVAVDGQARRLGQPPVGGRPVAQALDRRAGEHLGRARDRVDGEQQVHAGGRDHDTHASPATTRRPTATARRAPAR